MKRKGKEQQEVDKLSRQIEPLLRDVIQALLIVSDDVSFHEAGELVMQSDVIRDVIRYPQKYPGITPERIAELSLSEQQPQGPLS